MEGGRVRRRRRVRDGAGPAVRRPAPLDADPRRRRPPGDRLRRPGRPDARVTRRAGVGDRGAGPGAAAPDVRRPAQAADGAASPAVTGSRPNRSDLGAGAGDRSIHSAAAQDGRTRRGVGALGTEAADVLRLAKVTLCGFKSFADRTEFRFDDPVTAVVGPNGCGKSNIVDAIKWVLGERSAKSLRSKEMQDVIFAGSAARAPAGFASVTLTFDNPTLPAPIEPASGDEALADAAEEADPGESVIQRRGPRLRPLPIDTEAVSVERRLHRDGQSQYLINGKRARLRDIRELFLDTGIGADAYSIIEQGKVDAMLLASPTDRRTIFEEAAGIARFRARRLESMRKLDRTESNLLIAREQLATAERRLKTVRTQAERARTFRALDARLRGLRLALALHQYDELCSRLEGLTSRQHGLERERDAAIEDVEQIEARRQDAELERHEL
ncbi:MAG: hypothetical protein D6693_05760, partial [Planctomycetota bacterium]